MTAPPRRRVETTLFTAAVLAFVTAAPFALPPFWTTNILGRGMIYGIIALSLTFLARYGGFVSLAQMAIAGVAGYSIAITVPNAIPANSVGLSYVLAVPLALAASTLAGVVVGAIAVRSRDIYLLMITLAIAVGFYYLVQTNIEYLNGYEGIRNVVGPDIAGVPFKNYYVFYYATALVAISAYAAILYVTKSPFGLAMQGIRDNPGRVAALGYDVALHRIAAFAFAGFVAGCGGVLSTIYNIGISPGQISTHATISILIMAVIGGLGHPIGAFIGAIIFTLVDTFSASIYDRDRFNTLIGFVFLVIVLASPDGVVGLYARARALIRRQGARMLAPSRAGRSRPVTALDPRNSPATNK